MKDELTPAVELKDEFNFLLDIESEFNDLGLSEERDISLKKCLLQFLLN